MNAFTAIGLDVGGTKIAGGVATLPGATVHFRETVATPVSLGREVTLQQIIALASSLQNRSRSADLSVDGVGLGLCEIISVDGAIASHSLLRWPEAELREKLGGVAPLCIEADVRAAARAEALFGAGRDARCFLYISIGTGISSCLVIDGEPFTGAHGATGTFASAPFPCFIKGSAEAPFETLEQFASGPGIVSRFNAKGGAAKSAWDVLAMAGPGNREALEVVQSAACALGAAIGWLINVLDPERVILGGGLGLAEGQFRETLVHSARTSVWWPQHREVPILSAQTGSDAGWLGAAIAAWKNAGRQKGAAP